jgi:hypothetical protein
MSRDWSRVSAEAFGKSCLPRIDDWHVGPAEIAGVSRNNREIVVRGGRGQQSINDRQREAFAFGLRGN